MSVLGASGCNSNERSYTRDPTTTVDRTNIQKLSMKIGSCVVALISGIVFRDLGGSNYVCRTVRGLARLVTTQSLLIRGPQLIAHMLIPLPL